MPAEPHKYRQIADELRAAIKAGTYPPGSRLPSVADLMSRGFSLGTVKQAINLLKDEGLAYTEQGLGTFVSKKLPTEKLSESERVQAQIADLQEQIQRLAERLEFHQEHGGH